MLLLLVTPASYTQVISTAACTVDHPIIVTPEVSVFRTTSRITIHDLTVKYKDSFMNSPRKPVVSFGYDPNFYWFRLVIRNDELSDRQLMLLMSPVGMREGILFQRQNGSWTTVARNGMRIPFKERPYQYAHYVFPFNIKAGARDTIFLHMDASHAFKSYGFALVDPKGLAKFQNRVYFSFGIIIGLLTLFFLFNLYLYFSLKEKVHLWYALYISFLILIVIKNDQLDQEFFAGDSELKYRLIPILGIGAIGIAILMKVILMILTNIKRKSLLYRISVFVQLNSLLSGMAHFIAFNVKPAPAIEMIFFNWAKFSTILTILMILFLCVYSFSRGVRTAIFILAGLVVFLIGALQRLLFQNTYAQLFPPSIFHIGMVIETLIISFILIYRYRIDREEKNQYLKEKEELKNNFEKLMLQSKFEIQEQTLKNISQEIHDNIGQVLSLVKLNISKLKLYEKNKWDESIDDSNILLNKVIIDLRDLSKSLNTDYIQEKGLLSSIKYELEQIKKYGGFETELIVQGDEYRMEPQKELVLFRICQEAFNNIMKHSNATTISVKAIYGDALVLIIRDNGIGFNLTEKKMNGERDGLGLKNIYNRSALLGGSCLISSDPGGTEVKLVIPTKDITTISET